MTFLTPATQAPTTAPISYTDSLLQKVRIFRGHHIALNQHAHYLRTSSRGIRRILEIRHRLNFDSLLKSSHLTRVISKMPVLFQQFEHFIQLSTTPTQLVFLLEFGLSLPCACQKDTCPPLLCTDGCCMIDRRMVCSICFHSLLWNQMDLFSRALRSEAVTNLLTERIPSNAGNLWVSHRNTSSFLHRLVVCKGSPKAWKWWKRTYWAG